jgi:VanZ family protein
VRHSPLSRLLLAAYVLLVIYASLYPFSGWRVPGGPPFAFLEADWPRFLTAFDVGANLLGYMPLGLLCALALYPRVRDAGSVLLVGFGAAALSLLLEAGQSFLPARIPSQADVLANVVGALAGGIVGARLAPGLVAGGPLQRLRADIFVSGLAADLGLTLLGLWLFAQLNPASLLFGAGDLRDLLTGPAGPAHAARLFVSVEAAVAAANLVAVALLAAAVTRGEAPLRTLLLVLLVLALAVKTLAFAILMRAENVFAWLTPGAALGLAAGTAIMLAATALPRVARLALAAILLMVATVLVNLAPPNPYLVDSLKVWQQGHFLNFNGLTQFVGALWPFAALGYLVWLAAARQAGALR